MLHIDNLLEHFKGLGFIKFVDYSFSDPTVEFSYDEFLEKRFDGKYDLYVLQWDCFVEDGCLTLQISNWRF